MVLRRDMTGRRSVRVQASRAVSLTPESIAGAQLIQDLNSDLGIATLAGNVTTWVDQSPQVNTVTQASAGARPAYVAGVLDGHAAVRLNNKTLNRTDAFTGLALGDTLNLYFVTTDRTGLANYNSGLMALDDIATINHGLAMLHAGTTMYARITGFDAFYDDGVQASPRLLTFRVMATSHALDVNNVQKATAVSAGLTNTPNDEQLGGIFSGFNGNFDLFRVIIVKAPTAVQHASMLAYLRSQYPSVPIAL